MIHTLLVGFDFNPASRTGDKSYWVDLAPLLAASGIKLSVLSMVGERPVPSATETELEAAGVDIQYLLNESQRDLGAGSRGGLSLLRKALIKWRRAADVRRAIDSYCQKSESAGRSVDVVHFMDNMGPLSRWIAPRRVPVVTISAVTHMGQTSPLYARYLKLCYGGRLNVVAFSRAFKAWLTSEAGLPNSRVHYIRWAVPQAAEAAGIDRDADGPESVAAMKKAAKVRLGLDPGTPLVLWSGFIQQIGLEELDSSVEVASEYRRRGGRARFIFALKPVCYGDGSAMPRPSEEGIEVSATTKERFLDSMLAADVLLSFTLKERSILAPPLTWLESLARGTPIATLDTPGASEVVTQGVNGVLATDVDRLVEDLPALIEDSARMSTECAASLAACEGRIEDALQGYVRLWLRLLEEVDEGNGG